MWFDVEKKNDTTSAETYVWPIELWFDVEKKNDTTETNALLVAGKLWFDVDRIEVNDAYHVLRLVDTV